jgi:hypothetical protein
MEEQGSAQDRMTMVVTETFQERRQMAAKIVVEREVGRMIRRGRDGRKKGGTAVPVRVEGAEEARKQKNYKANLLLPALARITGLGGTLALVVGDSGARHVGRGAEEGAANGRPAIG